MPLRTIFLIYKYEFRPTSSSSLGLVSSILLNVVSPAFTMAVASDCPTVQKKPHIFIKSITYLSKKDTIGFFFPEEKCPDLSSQVAWKHKVSFPIVWLWYIWQESKSWVEQRNSFGSDNEETQSDLVEKKQNVAKSDTKHVL